jgi:hypothetical protein
MLTICNLTCRMCFKFVQKFLDNDFMCAKALHRLFIRANCRDRLHQDALAVDLDSLQRQQKQAIVNVVYRRAEAGLIANKDAALVLKNGQHDFQQSNCTLPSASGSFNQPAQVLMFTFCKLACQLTHCMHVHDTDNELHGRRKKRKR